MPALRLLAVFGVVAVALPALAASETSPAIEAVNKPGSGAYGEEHHAWSPAQVSILAGGVVTLRNPSAIAHGVQWVSGPATPACAGGVPVGTSPSASGTNWSGTCTFTQPGTYTFYCTVHGAEMSGTVTVAAAGAAPPPLAASPLAGSASEAVKLAPSQHGKTVRGSVAISSAGAGGRLQVELLASAASLARAGSAAQARVGRSVRASLPEGKVSFAVPLVARAKRALHRHGHLRLSVKVIVTPPSGPATTITRHVVMHG
jgi:plastocyanin